MRVFCLRAIWLFATAAFASVLWPAGAMAQKVWIPTYTANPGDVVKVQVNVDAGVRWLAGAWVLLDFSAVTPAGDPHLTPTSADDITYGVIPQDRQNVLAINLNQPGQANIGLIGVKDGNGPGALLTIPLRVPADAGRGHDTVYPLRLAGLELNDEDGFLLPCTAVGGSIIVPGRYMPGDLTGDGLINIDDVQAALRVALGLRQAVTGELIANDFDGDGRITIKDVMHILRYVLGLSPLR